MNTSNCVFDFYVHSSSCAFLMSEVRRLSPEECVALPNGFSVGEKDTKLHLEKKNNFTQMSAPKSRVSHFTTIQPGCSHQKIYTTGERKATQFLISEKSIPFLLRIRANVLRTPRFSSSGDMRRARGGNTPTPGVKHGTCERK